MGPFDIEKLIEEKNITFDIYKQINIDGLIDKDIASFGYMNDGKLNGIGRMTKGSELGEGQFKNGRLHGYGRIIE